MYLDITENELQLIIEEIVTFLGGYEVEVDLTKPEVLVAIRYAFAKFEKETSIWQLKNQFINAYGQKQGEVFSNQLATINFGFVRQITDWFATMSRVGGKVPWHKDYINLETGRQVYYLDKESSKPYLSGTRRIHRVMWYAKPELLASGFLRDDRSGQGEDILYSNAWNFTNSGLNYGNNKLGFLGYAFDSMLMMQSMETRNKLLFSEYYHSLSGDVLEISPTPGKTVYIPQGAKLFYYYWNEEELSAGRPLDKYFDGQSVIEDPNNPNYGNGLENLPPGQYNLIANPLHVNVEVVPWSSLSAWAKTFVKELAFAKCKYIQGSKWRKIQKSFPGGEADYSIEFDYASLLTEAAEEETNLIENLRSDLEALDIHNLSKNQKDMVEDAVQINKRNGRLWKFK